MEVRDEVMGGKMLGCVGSAAMQASCGLGRVRERSRRAKQWLYLRPMPQRHSALRRQSMRNGVDAHWTTWPTTWSWSSTLGRVVAKVWLGRLVGEHAAVQGG